MYNQYKNVINVSKHFKYVLITNIFELVTNLHDARSDARSVGELLALVVDLGGQFSGRCQHQTEWVLFATAAAVRRYVRRSAFVHLIQDRHQEGGRFAAAGLRARHHVAMRHDYRDGVLLDRRRRVVTGQRDVRPNYLCQLYFLKLE